VFAVGHAGDGNIHLNLTSPDEAARFRDQWQARVRALLLEHGDDPEVFLLRCAGG